MASKNFGDIWKTGIASALTDAPKPAKTDRRRNSFDSGRPLTDRACVDCRELKQQLDLLEKDKRKAEEFAEAYRINNKKPTAELQIGKEDRNTLSEQLSALKEQNTSLEKQLQSTKEEHDRTRALLADVFTQRLQTLTEERVLLQKEVDQYEKDARENKLRFTAVQQQAEALAQEKQLLQQNLDREMEKLRVEQQNQQALQHQLKKLMDPSHPCSRQKCKQTTAERDQLTKKFERKCDREECVQAKTKLEKVEKRMKQKCDRRECVQAKTELGNVEKRIKQMEKKDCNSTRCKNQELKDMNGTIGSKIFVRGKECSLSEALKFLVDRTETQDTKWLHSHLERLQEDNQQLRQKLSERQSRSAAKDMAVMSGGDYDEVLLDFEEVFTNPDDLLGVLESCLQQIAAKKCLCYIFQEAYQRCKEVALQRAKDTLGSLFALCEDKSKKEDLGAISRAYGLLLHVSGLSSDETVYKRITHEVMAVVAEHASYGVAGSALQSKQECLLKVVQVAWKFAILPCPIIACQPAQIISQNVDREYGYWDESTPNAELIYTRPIVYRCYDGKCAVKGMVANILEETKKECVQQT